MSWGLDLPGLEDVLINNVLKNKNLKTQVHNSTADLGHPRKLWRENEERFLHCADRHLRRGESERKASVCFGRNDKLAEVLTTGLRKR